MGSPRYFLGNVSMFKGGGSRAWSLMFFFYYLKWIPDVFSPLNWMELPGFTKHKTTQNHKGFDTDVPKKHSINRKRLHWNWGTNCLTFQKFKRLIAVANEYK